MSGRGSLTWTRIPQNTPAGVGREKEARDEEITKIAWNNACRFFSWDPFARTAREKATVGALRATATANIVKNPVQHDPFGFLGHIADRAVDVAGEQVCIAERPRPACERRTDPTEPDHADLLARRPANATGGCRACPNSKNSFARGRFEVCVCFSCGERVQKS